MGLFGALTRIVELPLSIGLDIVELPEKFIEGEGDVIKHTKIKVDQLIEEIDE